MKILHCIHSLYGGGAERQLTSMAEFGSQKCNHYVLCYEATESTRKVLGNNLIEVPFSSKKILKSINFISATVKEIRPNLIHSWLPVQVNLYAKISGALNNIPVVVSYRNRMRMKSYRELVDFSSSLLLADGLISNSLPEQHSRLHRWLYKIKGGVVIPNTVVVPESKLRSWKWIESDSCSLLYVGRITKQKNWQCLIRALKILPERYTLTICGTGEDEENLKKEAKNLDITDRITMLGYTNDVFEVMCRHHALVLPSWYEGMPNVVAEAIEVGLPVILSDISSNRFITQSSSRDFFFSPKSPVELAKRIEEVLSSKFCAENMARLQFESALRVDREKHDKLHIEYYGNVLERGQHG